jgi:TetR/AcrR family transcriptional regulator
MENGAPSPVRDKDALILAAARRRFDVNGYAKVTMDEIAEDVGMAKASLYYYFPTKEAIFRSVIQAEQDEFKGQADQLLREASPAPQKLRRYAKFRMELTGRLTLLNRFDPQTRKDVAPIFMESFASFDRWELHALQAIVDEGMKSGDFRLENPRKTAAMILNVLHGLRLRFFMNRIHPAAVPSGHAELEDESLLFVDTLLRGIETRNDCPIERNTLNATE